MSKGRVFVAILFIVALCLLLSACSSGLTDFSGISDKGGETVPGQENAYQEATTQAEAAACKANRLSLRSSVEMYAAEMGDYPTSLEKLVTEGYLDKIPTCSKSDKSGKPYTYDSQTAKTSCPNGHPDLDS